MPLDAATTVQVVALDALRAMVSSEVCARRHHWEHGTYFEFLTIKRSDGTRHCVIANRADRSTAPIERDRVWFQRRELGHYLFPPWQRESAGAPDHAGTLDREQLVLELVTQANIMKLGHGAGVEEVLETFFTHSQERFERATGAFYCGAQVYAVEHYDVGAPTYSHIEHFSWIYATELQLLHELAASHPERDLIVVDEGTGFGHFILTAARVLPADVLARVRFRGTDHKMKDMRFAQRLAERFPALHATWHLEDLEAPDHAARVQALNGGQPVDMLVLNHVVEHLEATPPGDFLLALLHATHDTLVLTVPLRDRLGQKVSSHTQEYD
jgi:hypothetical protein